MAEAKLAGLVKWFNTGKGYGFITPNDGGPDVFVHARHLTAAGIIRPLRINESVTFSSKKGDKGFIVTSIQTTSP